MYLLDTNIISYWMRGDKGVISKIRERAPSDLSFSSITLAEILYGIEKSPHKQKERRLKIERISSVLTLYNFDEVSAEKYAFIRNNLEKQGIIISERDMLIASIAAARGLTMVTRNVKEFQRVEDLRIEDWVDV